jgi:hypothetical protein
VKTPEGSDPLIELVEESVNASLNARATVLDPVGSREMGFTTFSLKNFLMSLQVGHGFELPKRIE